MKELTPQQIADYAALGLAAIQAGYQIYMAFRGLLKQGGMSDDQINMIENAMIAEDRRLSEARRAMSQRD